MSTNSSDRPLAVVTGASSGIGLSLAKQFATNGFDLLLVAEPEGLDQAAIEIQGLGATASTVGVDLASEEGVQTLIDRIQALGRPVDAAAINAGVGVGGPFVENDLDKELNLINLNVISTVRLAKFIVKEMVARGSGKILFTASVASVMPAPFEAIYGASKAFVFYFSEALRNELKDTGVSVTALMPGPTDTNFFHRAGMEDTLLGTGKKDDPDDVAKAGFEALMDGKDKVYAASLMSKMQAHSGQHLPEPVTAEMHRKMAEPGSATK